MSDSVSLSWPESASTSPRSAVTWPESAKFSSKSRSASSPCPSCGPAARARGSRSSWSWSRSTAWDVSAMAPSLLPALPRPRAPGCLRPGRPGVGGLVDGPEPLRRHLRVHLRGREAGVARAAPGPPGCRRRGRACGSRTSGAARAGTGGPRRPARSPAARTISQHALPGQPAAPGVEEDGARRRPVRRGQLAGVPVRRGSRRPPRARCARAARPAPCCPCPAPAPGRRRGRGRRGRGPTSSLMRSPPA